ncbi:MAG: outer membrane beta-barrel protein, partial [Bacteroidetes bacterium]|nr:outer membrane beta-barrel protein [Bacteroidota bacterium]
MKSTLIICIALLFILINLHLSKAQEIDIKKEDSKFSIGVVGGINFPLSGYNVSHDFYDSSTVIVPGYDSISYYHSEQFRASPAIGVNFGFLLNYRISKRFSFQTGLIHSREIGKVNVDSLEDVTTKMLNIPIVGVINFTDNITGMFGWYGAVNLSSGKTLNNTASVITNSMKGFNLGGTYHFKSGMNLGVKYKFNRGKGKGVTYINSGNFSWYYKTYNVSSFQILLGYDFPRKKKKKEFSLENMPST